MEGLLWLKSPILYEPFRWQEADVRAAVVSVLVVVVVVEFVAVDNDGLVEGSRAKSSDVSVQCLKNDLPRTPSLPQSSGKESNALRLSRDSNKEK